MTHETQHTQLEQPMLPFEMSQLSEADQASRGWELQINDEAVSTLVHGAKLINSRMGVELTYAKRPEGYDGFVIREPGGAATMPYMVAENGRYYVGVVREARPTMGEAVTENIPRGFSDFKADGTKESSEETARRELGEETGLRDLGAGMIKLAEGLNPNSTFFDYSRSRQEGVALYAVQVQQKDLELTHDDNGEVYYVFPAHVREQAEGDKTAERILGSRFIPLTEALDSRDMFTSAAAGQLLAHLVKNGEYIVPQNMVEQPAGADV